MATLLTALLAYRQTALILPLAVDQTFAPVLPERQLDSRPDPSAPGEGAQQLLTSSPAVPAAGTVIHPERFFYEPDFYAPQIQAWLETQAGPLKEYRSTVGDREHSFAEILSSQTTLYSINPKVVLALIEQQSGLVTTRSPTAEQQQYMLGFRGEGDQRAGWVAQLRWVIRELHRAQRDYPAAPVLVYADDTRSPLPPEYAVAEYAVARVLAATTTAAMLPAKLDGGAASFVAVYTRLFGDPRAAVATSSAARTPFLSLPMQPPYDTQSFFDHDAPYLQQNASIVTYQGERSDSMPYDGHDGWDYGMVPPQPVLAAADGTVIFAGNSDDGCGVAKAVIIDHGNGYRSLYWHLTQPSIEPGPVKRGAPIGIVGSSGCVTGPHLHFQVQYLGRDVDPYGWCGAPADDPWAAHPAGQRSTWLWRDTPNPCALPDDAIVVDTADGGFRRIGPGWSEAGHGFGGTALRVPSVAGTSQPLTVGVWKPQLPRAGTYRVLAWVPYVLNGLQDVTAVDYVVGHADGSADTRQVAVSQVVHANGWADLGTYALDPARQPFVGLSPQASQAGNNVWYDAVVWLPVP